MALFFLGWVRYGILPYLRSAYLKRTWLVEVSLKKEYGRCYKRLGPDQCVEGAPSTWSGSSFPVVFSAPLENCPEWHSFYPMLVGRE
jgi:hypothetical protein